MEYRICSKCGKLTFVHKHHLLPKSVFGENDETDWLCPNCHTEYHLKLGTENLKNPDMKFHLYFYYKWLYGLLGILLILLYLGIR